MPVVSNTITFDRRELLATPTEISADRQRLTWGSALIGGMIVAGIGYALHGQGSDRLRNTLLVGAAGAAVGGIIGHSVKTKVEQRTEALQAIASQPHFGEHLKQEMAKRERSSFWNGFAVGTCVFW